MKNIYIYTQMYITVPSLALSKWLLLVFVVQGTLMTLDARVLSAK
uniref:Uncharacterized protein n=1 Tax=Lepeophtheirus salmonis TaxID=72036 RepID=A0A0K2VGX1_LEPSM